MIENQNDVIVKTNDFKLKIDSKGTILNYGNLLIKKGDFVIDEKGDLKIAEAGDVYAYLPAYKDENNKANEQSETGASTEENVSNEVVLNGYVCKKPIYRKTPFGREISDILLAVNRAYNKSDYIPCIAWGRNARFCENMEVGTEVKVVGRVQSRTYEKKFEDGRIEQRVAYEVSIGSLEVINKDENSNQNEEAEAI